ncbi:MAG: hypothetical protein IJB80_06980 [Clostridia bacterium]|nr:hypothetical protein [Clostridia bacterium]
MKRIVSIILVIGLVLSLFTFGYASEVDTSGNDEILVKCRILEGLGIIPPRKKAEYHKTTLPNDRTLAEYGSFRNTSKSAFINYLCNIYGDYGYTDDYSKDAISFAEQRGIIHSGQTDLNKPLYFDEAITMLVRLLGYEFHAQEMGGFPAGYLSIASRLGLTEGVVARPGDRLQDYDAAYLLYNAINCAYVDEKVFTEDGVIYGTTSENTLLYEFRKIYKIEGVVDATETMQLRPGLDVPTNGVMIDGQVYTAEEDVSQYVGLNVEAYVQKKNNGLDTVLFTVGIRNREIQIQDEDIIGISPDFQTLTYYVDQSQRKVNISPIAKIIYNGQPVMSKNTAMFQPEYGSVRLINNDSGTEYDVVFITSYKTVVIDSISKISEKVNNVFTHNAQNQILDLNDEDIEDNILIEDAGKGITFKELQIGDVLTVTESQLDGRRVVVAIRSTETVEGTIVSVNTKEEMVVRIGSKDYTLTPEYAKALAAGDSNAKTLSPGLAYTFYLDCNGKIAYADDEVETTQYGIVFAKAEEGNFNKTYRLKLYTTAGKFQEYVINDKIVFDGSRGVETKNIFASIQTSASGVLSVIAYETDATGNISSIDLPKQYDPDSNVCDTEFNSWENQKHQYFYGNYAFNSVAFMEDSSVFIKVDPNSLQDELSYSISSRSAFEDQEDYSYSAYAIDEYGFAKLFVILQKPDDTLGLQTSDIFIVESIGKEMTIDWENVDAVTGMMGNYDSVTFYCDDSTVLAGVQRGDVISLVTNTEGFIKEIKIHRSVGQTNMVANPTQIHGKEAFVHGEVAIVNPAALRIKIDCGEYGMRTIRCHDGMPVFIYDSEDDRFFRGTLADVEKGDQFTSKLRGSKPHAIVIYR